jgi:hypothetical protein
MEKLYKLNGYERETDTYINPQNGEVENLPSAPFAESEIALFGYSEASEQEISYYFSKKPTLLAILAGENSYPFMDELQIEYDKCGFLSPGESKYGLKGEKKYKNYYNNNVLVVSQIYETIYETKTHEGFTVQDVPVGTIKKIRFYKNATIYKEKLIETLNFDVYPSEALDEQGQIVDVSFNSMKLEKFLKENRYEADSLMKSFNSTLYNWLYSSYGGLYTAYLQTGNSTPLKLAFQNETNPTNLFILGKLVEEKDLKVLLGEMVQYPQVTVKDLIIMNLQ